MFSGAMVGQDRATRFAAATKAMSAVAMILIVAALIGAKLLTLFGISLNAFEVAGGAVLVWIGVTMFGQGESKPSATSREAGSLGPLIMFAASPGTITGVITIAASHAGTDLPVSALIAVVVAVLVTWIVIIALAEMSGSTHPSFWHGLLTKYMGLIVIAMGVQIALTGWKNFNAT